MFGSNVFTEGPIIRSLMDTDAYKLHMQQAIQHLYPDVHTVYEFKCRLDEDLRPYKQEIIDQIKAVGELRFQESEIRHLKTKPFIRESYLSFLRYFRMDPDQVLVTVHSGQLKIRAEGPWVSVMMWEIYILAIVSEIRNRHLYSEVTFEDIRKQLALKVDRFKDKMRANPFADTAAFKLADFGTRRRFSLGTQWEVVDYLRHELGENFVGTSNYMIAQEMGLNAIGTQAHEWCQAHQALVRLKDSQKSALQAWSDFYRGYLGIALTDCISMESFLKDFDLHFAKLFDGLRHDSGSPYQWAEMAISHYEKMGIDPKTKTLVFSDGLSLDKAYDLFEFINGRIQTSFGIGTNLTCDIPGVKPLNIVMKMTECDDQPVAKLSDSPGKTMSKNTVYLDYLKQVFNYSPMKEQGNAA